MKILEVYADKLRNRRKAENTIGTYVGYLKLFLIEENIKDAYAVTTAQITKYLEGRTYSSASQQNQIIASLKGFAKYVLKKKDLHLDKIQHVPKNTKLQLVIPRYKILAVLATIKNIKHRTILTIAYACGLRVSEIINLQWCNIDREEKVIYILNSKGGTNRMVPITQNLIDLLIEYFKEHKTRDYVFTGQNNAPQYSASSCDNVVKAKFGKQYRFHSLRKSCLTHLYDLGNDMSKIQDLAGHKSQKTTRIYVQSSAASLRHLTPLLG